MRCSRATLVCGLCVIWSSWLFGRTYVVAPAGNDNNAGTVSAPWRTLAKANGTLVSGDTVVVRGGTYHERIAPVRSGISGSPIVYRSYPGELVVADGPDDADLNLVAVYRSWVVIEGFTFRNQDYFDLPGNNDYWVVLEGSNNVFRYNRLVAEGDVYENVDTRHATSRGIAEAGRNNTIEHCFIRGLTFGIVIAGSSPRYTVLRYDTVHATWQNNIDVGATGDGTTAYHGTLIEYCVLDTSVIEDNIQFEPDYGDPTSTLHNRGTIIRNNVMGNAAENAIDLKGAGHTIIENNLIYSSSGDDDGPIGGHDAGSGGGVTANPNNPTRNTIVRKNVIWDHCTGLDMAEGDHYFNNTILNNRRTWQGPNQTGNNHVALRAFNYPNAKRAFLNNIVAGQSGGGMYEWLMDWGDKFHLDNNLYYEPGAQVRFLHRKDGAMIATVGLGSWKSELASYGGYRYVRGKDGSAIEADPAFVNAPVYAAGYDSNWDFGLKSSSPGVDAGTAVTTATSGGSGSTTLTVDDAYFFCDGFGITEGDLIRVDSGAAVRILAIDHNRNLITLSEPRTWSSGSGVSLSYSGQAPDIGAYETTVPGAPDPQPQLPGVVQPGSPADGARDVSLQSSLSWSQASNAVSYHVQASLTSSFASNAIDKDGIAGTSYPIAGLANNTAYFWRVRGANTAGAGVWSVVRSFTTAAPDTTKVDPPLQPPGAIQLTAPADGTSGVSLQSSLTWASAPTAASYQVQVSPVSSFETLSIDQDSLTTTSYPIATLAAGRTHYWRVRGANTAGAGAWSTVRSFTTAAPDTTTPDPPQQPPGVVQLNSPADGTRDLALQSSLSWTAAPTALSYHVQVSLTSSFGSRAIDEDSVENTSFPIAALAGSTTYYWRVRGYNRGGYGSWSTARSFTTAGTTGGSGKEGTQLLQNGSFENGAQGWTYFSNGSGGFSTAGPAFKGSAAGRIAITSPGDNIQLYQSGIEISANTYYRLTFSAYSSTGHDLAVGLMKHGTPYTSYGLVNRWVNLGTGWETHTVYLRTANFTGTVSDARLQFWLPGFAKEGDEYWFDDVLVQQIDSPPLPETPRVLNPAPGAADLPNWTTLSWTKIDGADGYLVQLARDSTFSRLVCDTVVTDTQMVAGPLESATCYYRRIRALNIGGCGSFTQVCSFTTTVAKTEPEQTKRVPLQVSLEQNYPNPFNPSTVIEYHLPDQAHVTLKVYNALGVEVAVVDEGERSAGIHSVPFAASGLASGTYFYTLRTNGQVETRKMMLLH
ncbi:MAG: hypothetical protein H6Q31_706 [Bacteroidetes bacterium]|nr:hypothetical protein [Bacteroidota bacterium]